MFPERSIWIDHCDFPGELFEGVSKSDECFGDSYLDASEELDSAFLEGRGPELQTIVWFHSNHAYDIPVMWGSKHQTAIQASSYGAEFIAGRTTTHEEILIRYMLRCIGMRIKGKNSMPDNNFWMVQSCTRIDATLQKKEQAIYFHTYH